MKKSIRTSILALCVALVLSLCTAPAFAANLPKLTTFTTGSSSSSAKVATGTLNKALSGNYYITSAVQRDRYLDVDGGYTGNGGKVQTWGPTQTSAQKWSITHLGNGRYKIVNIHSLKALESPTASSPSGTAVRQQTYTGSTKQQWYAYSYNGKTVFVNVATKLALDVRNSNKNIGTVVQEAKRTNSAAQQWGLQKLNGISVDYVKLNRTSLNLQQGTSSTLAATSYPSMATGNKTAYWTTSNAAVASVSNGKVTAKGAGTATITATIQGKKATCTVTVPKPATPKPAASTPVTLGAVDKSIASGYYFVKSALGNCYLDVDGGNKTTNAKIQVWGYTGVSPQVWYITNKGNGIYTFTNAKSNMALDVPNGTRAAGQKLRQWPVNNAPAQQWRAYVHNGKHVFVNVASGLALDVQSGIGRNGTPVQQWGANKTTAQGWSLSKASFNDDELATQIFNSYNDFRARKGLNRTTWSPLLAEYALKSAQQCAARNKLEHRLGVPGHQQTIFSDILQCSTWKKLPGEAVASWEASTGHRKMMQCSNGTIHAGAAAYYDTATGKWWYAIVYNFAGCNQSGA